MSHIFISYSQKNKSIAETLEKKLKNAGKDVWIDLQNLPASIEWWKAIERAIAEADAFVYLLSPESIVSEYCQKEVEKARSFNKRIFPILLPGTSEKDLPKEIIDIQFLRWNYVETAEGLEKLLHDIDTDHEWVKFHTDLLAKAYSWQDKKDTSHLLRGKVLEDAETQLTQSQNKKPEPVNLQREFVLASRKWETRNRQSLLATSVVGLLILVILLVFGLNQRNLAIINETTAKVNATNAAIAQEDADKQAQIAQAEQLASIALTQLDKNLDLGLLLSVEAFKRAETSQTNRSLYLAWQYNSNLIKHFQGYSYPSPATAIAWSKDGRIAIASSDYESNQNEYVITVWSLEDKEPLQILFPTSETANLAWSDKGVLASTSASSCEIYIWDVQDAQITQTLDVCARDDIRGTIDKIAWSNDERLTSIVDEFLIIWDLEKGLPEQILQDQDGSSIRDFAWSQDGRLASILNDTTVVVWNLDNPESSQILSADLWNMSGGGYYFPGGISDMQTIAWTDDERLFTSTNIGIVFWDLQNNEPGQVFAEILPDRDNSAWSFAWSSEGLLAFPGRNSLGLANNTIEIWDIESEQHIQTLVIGNSIIYNKYIVWAESGLLAVYDDNAVIVWDLKNAQKKQVIIDYEDLSAVNSIAWSGDGQLALGGGRHVNTTNGGPVYDNTVVILDLQNDSSKVLEGHTNQVHSLAWSRDGRLASGGKDGLVIVWDLMNETPLRTLRGHNGGFDITVAWSDKGQLASVEDDGNVIIWDLENEQPAQTLGSSTTAIAWSHDGRLAIGTTVWDLQSNKETQGGLYYATSVAWSEENYLASGSMDGKIVVWDLLSGKPVITLYGHTSEVTSIGWSSDGRLASGSTDGTVIIWDLPSGKPMQILQSEDVDITSLAWSADGRIAFVSRGYFTNVITVLEMNPETWIEQSCRRAGRNLTQEEWDYYFPNESYRPTCSDEIISENLMPSSSEASSEQDTTSNQNYRIESISNIVVLALCCCLSLLGIILIVILIARFVKRG